MSIPSSAPLDARTAFALELAAHPDHHDITARLRTGHEPDGYGWCRHGAHAHRWEHHPCSVVRLADLVDRAAAGTLPGGRRVTLLRPPVASDPANRAPVTGSSAGRDTAMAAAAPGRRGRAS